MATINLIPVVIHYTVTPTGVQARVRTYAGLIAIEERTHEIAFADLAVQAQKAGRADFAPADVAALVPVADTIWGADAMAVPILAGDLNVADLVKGLP